MVRGRRGWRGDPQCPGAMYVEWQKPLEADGALKGGRRREGAGGGGRGRGRGLFTFITFLYFIYLFPLAVSFPQHLSSLRECVLSSITYTFLLFQNCWQVGASKTLIINTIISLLLVLQDHLHIRSPLSACLFQ